VRRDEPHVAFEPFCGDEIAPSVTALPLAFVASRTKDVPKGRFFEGPAARDQFEALPRVVVSRSSVL